MATAEAKRLREALNALGKRGRNEAYPMALRRRLIRYWERELKEGRSRSSVARDVGLHPNTFRNWEKPKANGRAKMVRVRVGKPVEEPQTREAVALVSPAGYRLEGLSVDEAVQALRELS